MKTLNKLLALIIIIASNLLFISRSTAQIWTNPFPVIPFHDEIRANTLIAEVLGGNATSGELYLQGFGLNSYFNGTYQLPSFMLDVYCDPTNSTLQDINVSCINCTPVNSVGYRIDSNYVIWTSGDITSLYGAVGAGFGYSNTVSSFNFNNTVVGYLAYQNFGATGAAAGQKNSAFGSQALTKNTKGAENCAFGYLALESNDTGKENMAIGTQALQANTYGNANSAIGHAAMWRNKTGSSNIAVGENSLYHDSINNYNVAVGVNALFSTKADYNTSTGALSGNNLTTGTLNNANGYKALYGSVSLGCTGSWNSANGAYSLSLLSTGDSNTGAGYGALEDLTTGNGDVALGYQAGILTNVNSDNLFLGTLADENPFYTITNGAAIGYQAIVPQSNDMVLGNNNMQVTVGLSNVLPGPPTRLELNTEYGAGSFTVTASSTPPIYINHALGTGWSGLRFDDLTAAHSIPTRNPGAGVLGIDSAGNVIYILDTLTSPAANIGTCSNPNVILNTGGGGEFSLSPNLANFYFEGTSPSDPTKTDVVIGHDCIHTPKAKLDVFQNSNLYTNGSIGIYVENDDVSSGVLGSPVAVIGIKSVVPYIPSVHCDEYTNVAGWFQANNPPCTIGDQQEAIYVPHHGGLVNLGYPLGTFALSSSTVLAINGSIDFLGSLITSDSILKRNVTPFNYGIKAIRNLSPINYQYNGIGDIDTTGKYIGLLAQNVMRNVPSAVRPSVITDTATGDTMTIENIYEEGVLYTAINAIKEIDSAQTKNASAITSTPKGVLYQRDSVGKLHAVPTVRGNSFSAMSDGRYNTSANNIPNPLSIVEALKGQYSNWNTSNYRWRNFPSGQQVSFDGSATNSVLPQVVSQDDSGYYEIDYGRVVPILTEAMKQQQGTIDSLKNVLNSIQNCLSTLCSGSGDAPVHHSGSNGNSGDSNSAISNVQDVMLSGMANAPLLYQNIPNPFTTGTKINYFLPQGTVGATLVFYDTYGNQLKTVPLSQTGNGTLNITPDNLSSGIYSYSLIVNSNVVDTKRMILQK